MKYAYILIIVLFSSLATFAQFSPKLYFSGCSTCKVGFTQNHDMDNDGDQDILLFSFGDYELGWYENDSDGDRNFETYHVMRNFDNFANLISFEDLNGDGFPDFIFTEYERPHFYYLNDGNNQLSTKVLIPEIPLATSSSMFFLEDIDGDGDNDILTRNVSEDHVSFLINDGTGQFSDTELFDGDYNIRCLSTNDVDNDGDLDIIMCMNPSDQLLWFEQTSSGTFAPIAPFVPINFTAGALKFADMDGDGLDDIIYPENYFSGDSIEYLHNEGNNIYTSTSLFSGQDMENLKIEDMDQDGDLDIVGTLSNGNQLAWFENDGEGNFSDIVVLINGFMEENTNSIIQDMKIIDFDNDGIKDILGSTQNLSLYEGQSNFSYSRNIISGPDLDGYTIVKQFDFNLDGNEDILGVSLFGDVAGLIYLSNSNHEIIDTIDFTNALGDNKIGIINVEIADFDGDGDIDLLLDNANNARLVWLENNGTGYTRRQIYEATDDVSYNQFVDFNSDGILDIVSYTFDDGILGFQNIGNGTVNPPIFFYPDVSPSNDLKITDFDEDGDTDFLINTIDTLFYLQNMGDGNFEIEFASTNFQYIKEFEVMDIDKDGLKDIVYIESEFWGGRGRQILWSRNEGQNNWGAPMQIYASNERIRNLAIEDIDLDGDLDVFAILEDTFYPLYSLMWVENISSGSFSASQFIGTSYLQIRNFSFLDFDQDGFKEIFITEEYKISYFQNLFGKPSIIGNLFWDENENKIFDDTEYGISGFPISVTPAPITAFSDENGRFRFIVDAGDYSLTIDTARLDQCWELSTDSVSYSVTAMYTEIPENNFGLTSTSTFNQFSPGLTSGPPRCGFEVPFWLSVKNTGCSLDQSRYGIVLDPRVSFVEANVPPTMTNGDTLFWETALLIPDESAQIRLKLQMPGVEAIDSTIYIEALSFIKNTDDEYVPSGRFTYEGFISCAYDPNDKLVAPSQANSDDNFALFTDTLAYTIRFQNTGTDTAFNIIIRDTLDTNLDWSTFQPLESSHYFESSINRENGAVAFSFPNVLLPDSTINEFLSHGFVQYQILVKENLPENIVIPNTAHIYFDFNPAVVTNTIKNTLFDEYFVTAQFTLPSCNNGEDGTIDVSFPFLDDVFYNWDNNQTSASLTNLSAGNYTLSLTDNRGTLLLDTTFTIEPQTVLELTTSSTPTLGGTANGTATATVDGGTPPYTYVWNTEPVQTTATAMDLVSGDYSVTITDQNGCTGSSTVTVDITTSTSASAQLNKFTLSPNPTKAITYANLIFNAPTNWNLHLTNVLGQRIKSFHPSQNEVTNAVVEISELKSGLYYLTLVVGGKVVRVRTLVVME